MSWRIFVTDTAAADFARLEEAARTAVNEDLFAWVESGPPKGNIRRLGELELYEDEVPSGFRIAYFIDESEPYVALLRVRRLPRPEA